MTVLPSCEGNGGGAGGELDAFQWWRTGKEAWLRGLIWLLLTHQDEQKQDNEQCIRSTAVQCCYGSGVQKKKDKLRESVFPPVIIL